MVIEMKEPLDDFFELHGQDGECGYCGAKEKVIPEPFNQKLACKPCWDEVVND
jgi:hypothetical protein